MHDYYRLTRRKLLTGCLHRSMSRNLAAAAGKRRAGFWRPFRVGNELIISQLKSRPQRWQLARRSWDRLTWLAWSDTNSRIWRGCRLWRKGGMKAIIFWCFFWGARLEILTALLEMFFCARFGKFCNLAMLCCWERLWRRMSQRSCWHITIPRALPLHST